MTPESRKKHFWTERAGYKGRESFTGALMSHRADTQHPPSPQSTQLSLGMVPPPPILHLPFQCLPRFYSGFRQGDPFSVCVALAKPFLQVLLYWHQLWFHFCTRERAPIFLIACLNAFPSLRCCMLPMERGYGLFQRFQHCRSLAPF